MQVNSSMFTLVRLCVRLQYGLF